MGRTKGSKNKPGHNAGGRRPNAGRRKGRPDDGHVDCPMEGCNKRFLPKGPDLRTHILAAHAPALDDTLTQIVEAILAHAGADPTVFRSTVDGLPLPPDHPLSPDNPKNIAKMKRNAAAAAAAAAAAVPPEGVPPPPPPPPPSGDAQLQQQQQQPQQQQQQQTAEQDFAQQQQQEADGHQFIAESYTHDGADLAGVGDEYTHHHEHDLGTEADTGGAQVDGHHHHHHHHHHELSDFQHDLQQHLHHHHHHHLQHDDHHHEHDVQQHPTAAELDGAIIAQVMATYTANRDAELAEPSPAAGDGVQGQQQQPAGAGSSAGAVAQAGLPDASLSAGIMSILRRNTHLYPSGPDGALEYVDDTGAGAGLGAAAATAAAGAATDEIDPTIDPSLSGPTLAGPSGMAAFPPPPAPSSSAAAAAASPSSRAGAGVSAASSAGTPIRTSSLAGAARARKPYDRPDTPRAATPSSAAASAAAGGRESSATPRGPRKCKRCMVLDPDGAISCPGRYVRANCDLNQRVAEGKVVLQHQQAAGAWDPAGQAVGVMQQQQQQQQQHLHHPFHENGETSPLSNPGDQQQQSQQAATAQQDDPLGGGGDPSSSTSADPPSLGSSGSTIPSAHPASSSTVGVSNPSVPNALYVLPPTTGAERKPRHCKVCIYHGRDGKACPGRGDRKKCKDYSADEDGRGAYGRHKKDGSLGAGVRASRGAEVAVGPSGVQGTGGTGADGSDLGGQGEMGQPEHPAQNVEVDLHQPPPQDAQQQQQQRQQQDIDDDASGLPDGAQAYIADDDDDDDNEDDLTDPDPTRSLTNAGRVHLARAPDGDDSGGGGGLYPHPLHEGGAGAGEQQALDDMVDPGAEYVVDGEMGEDPQDPA